MRSKYIYIRYFVLVFYILQVWRYVQHEFLSQIDPVTIVLRYDLAGGLLAGTGIPTMLIESPHVFGILDVIYVILPVISYFMYRRGCSVLFFIPVLFYFYIYCLLLSLYPSISLETTVYMQVIPLLFLVRSKNNIVLVKEALRYFISMVMVAAGYWKVKRGAVWNEDQMSNILLDHNLPYILDAGWQQSFNSFLIDRPYLSQYLFIAATILELSFIVAFFTHRLDRVLMCLLILFVLLDYFVMRIPYFSFLTFLIFFVPLEKRTHGTT